MEIFFLKLAVALAVSGAAVPLLNWISYAARERKVDLMDSGEYILMPSVLRKAGYLILASAVSLVLAVFFSLFEISLRI